MIHSAPNCTTFRKKVAAVELIANTAILQQTKAFCSEITPTVTKDKNKEENIRDFMEPPVNTKIKNLQKDEETTSLSPRGELLRWHIRLGHLSFSKMINLMELGILPHKLLKIRPPMCACCKIGAMTKQRRRVKGGKYKNMRKANAPGECVSMDQIESRIPGFIGVLRDFINKKRNTCATIFVDHYSGFTYVKLQTSTNMDERLKEQSCI